MKKFLLASVTALLVTGAAHAADMSDKAVAAFHKSLLTIDTHVDVGFDLGTGANDTSKLTPNQVDLVKMKKGGLDAVFFIGFSEQTAVTPENIEKARKEALSRIFAIKRMVEQNPGLIAFAQTADDVERINKTGKLVALLGIENGYPMGDDPDWVRLFYDAGARYMGITHFGHNQLGDSSNPSKELGDEARKYGGLSDLGRKAIAEMNRLGVMVDTSHSAMTTTIQAAELSKAPIIASHSGVRAVGDVERNLSDDALKAIAKNGGVAQMVAFDGYVRPNPARRQAIMTARGRFGVEGSMDVARLDADKRAAYDAMIAEIDAAHPPATVKDFVDHIDYAVKLAGIDHVGIASDFDGGGGVKGWNDAAETPNVTKELLARGYSKADIRKLWGGNLLRVMRAVEATAKELQAASAATGQ